MKKIFFVALTIVTINAFAVGPFTFGTQVGINASSVNLKTNVGNNFSAENLTGVRGGVFARLTIKKVILQPEVHLSVVGAKFNFDVPQVNLSSGQTTINNISQTVRSTNLEIPLMLGYQLVDLKLLKLRVHAGPVISSKLNESVTIDTKGANINYTNATEFYKNSQTNGALGLGIDILNFTLDARYHFGLGNISQIPNTDFRNNYFAVMLGFKFI
jgi:hypothetical protein